MPEISHNVYLHLQYVWFYNTKLQVAPITRAKRRIEENGRIQCEVSCITRYVPWQRFSLLLFHKIVFALPQTLQMYRTVEGHTIVPVGTYIIKKLNISKYNYVLRTSRTYQQIYKRFVLSWQKLNIYTLWTVQHW